ncbi:exportin-2-like [Salvia miltiorrhiza]|uniref:exportin-2-like n=1 Tax=Salvia miltiorrhiza TaxID=226208 RepID=UPI0025AD6F50|nr:exportin-2-like [Salvia miltiorrhiza]
MAMEWNDDALQVLSQCFINTLSPLPEPRRRAEAALAEAADRANYGLAVLRLVAEPAVDEQIRQSAAVNFKNHLKARWAAQNPDDPDRIVMPDTEKEQIKGSIVRVMVTATPKIQPQLGEALTVIGNHDFPRQWRALLPELVVKLDELSQANDYVSVNGILAAVDSLLKKFRYEYKTNDLLLDLKYCLDSFARPLLQVFQRTACYLDHAVGSGAANAVVLKGYIESQTLCCWIFYSFNYMDLPEFFEDHMNEWMVEFNKYLTVKYSALEDSGSDGLAVVDDLRAVVCENISLYMKRDEETFHKYYLKGFVEAVWGLLVAASNSSSRESLTVTAIKFLTTVSTSVHHTLFARDDILQKICQSIVIPNVMLRDEDEELFEMNYIEFIRRDMEGSDLETRRRIACELLKGIALNYKERVAQKASAQIKSLLVSFSQNPAANWKHKDCAIYLVVSLATKKASGTSISTDLVDVESFFGSVIVPELQDVDGFPMLKAGALKFFTMFRNQIPKAVAVSLLHDVARFLVTEKNVVHSYAASCIEKLLLVKDEGGRARYSAEDISSKFLETLMTNLFVALQRPESEENRYVMKCIVRVLGVANISHEDAVTCINELATVLNRVCGNPKNPDFNHHLFDSVALLIRRACEQDPSIASAFETRLLPILQEILWKDVTEFFPYAFQLLALLVDFTRSPLPENYMKFFEILLLQDSWKKSANVPSLVRLLQAFLRKAPHELNQQGCLSNILGIFESLVSSRTTAEQGFYVLNTVIENLGYDVVSAYISHIWLTLFQRLQSNKTTKIVTSLIVFMSLFLVKHGPEKLAGSMNAVQADVFIQILEKVWIRDVKSITGPMELKLTSVASTRILCECLSPLHSECWGKLLDSIVTLVSRPEEERVDEEEPEDPDFSETIGSNAARFLLRNAGRKDEDPVPDIKDPRQFLVASLANLAARSPGTLPRIIAGNLDPANQTALLQLCSSYNFTIV